MDLLTSRATIRPYLDPNSDGNMGLERHGLVVFDNTHHTEPLTYLTHLGRDRYLTGLDEFAPEVDQLGEEERQARIKTIREIVAFVEARVGGSAHLKPEDPDFWGKVRALKSDNHEFWGSISLRCGNQPIALQPKTDIKDLLKILAIKAGGFSIVAPSLEAARKMDKPPKFFLDEEQSTLSVQTEVKKLRNKAGGILERLFDKERNKLLLVAKVLDGNSVQYRKSTNPDILYQNLDLFLDGKLDANRKPYPNIQLFLKVTSWDAQTLKLQAVVKDAILFRFITRKSDGFIYETSSGNLLGRNLEDVVEYLKNPLHEQTLQSLLEKVEEKWR